ncbi:MAG: competence/damage-inducible protein A [Phycisphaerales bacterium]|nr:competence/damage-inducible protein A [Phycisphaerales bacterium]
MNAIILSIGDELVLGQTVDTNSAYLSAQLAGLGLAVSAHVTVADDQPAIEQAIGQAIGQCTVLLISGGLGPTADDLTRQVLAAVMGVELEMNHAWLHRLRAFFAERGHRMPEANTIQAMIPRGASMIDNVAGTAAGIDATIGACHIMVMPGVPREMEVMFQRDIAPRLAQLSHGAVILSRTLHTFGVGESRVAEMLGDLMRRDRNPSVGTTVSQGIVSLRINSRFQQRIQAQQALDETEQQCRAQLGDLIYGADGQPLAEVLGMMLIQRRATVAVAESCTGGMLADYLTEYSGASAYFKYGWVTYANEAKISQLGVSPQVLEDHGAVSEPVVAQMARGARERSGADYALSISGIAGPTGATADKPVGTVCIGLAHDQAVQTHTFHFSGERHTVRDRSAKMAMTLLRFHLLGKSLPS